VDPVIGLGGNLAVTAGVVLMLVLVTFAVALRRDRYDTIDSAWGLGFAVVALVTFGLSGGHGDPLSRALAAGLTTVWGVRLSVHIHARNRGQPEDRRYAEMVRRAGPRARGRLFTRVYLTQAGVLWLVSLPVQVAQYGPAAPAPVRWLGVAVWAVGFVFESVGDRQLSRFRADPDNRGRVLDSGLWRYTRHPNYFGDACVWWGLYLLACHGWLGIGTVISPLAMTALLAKGSGKPMLERDIAERRPEYADYVRRTSGFIPLPPRPRES
jgi:steroid 5-alpha reductase family enzyme